MGYLPDNSDERDKLLEEIKKLETLNADVEKPKLPTVKLEEMSYTPPSDNELKSVAERSLADYKREQTDAINRKSAEDAEALEKKRDDYAQKKEGELKAVSDAYATASENIDADVLRRGLARSTIAVNRKSELEQKSAQATADVESTYGKIIAELDAEISDVGNKLNRALNDFNISYATKLASKLDELKSERNKRIDEVTRYNNEVRAKQATLDANRLKTESSLYSDALKQNAELDVDNLPKEQREAVYKAVFDRMDTYLSSLSKDQAKQELKNHAMYREHLSDYYFYKLYDKYGRS